MLIKGSLLYLNKNNHLLLVKMDVKYVFSFVAHRGNELMIKMTSGSESIIDPQCVIDLMHS